MGQALGWHRVHRLFHRPRLLLDQAPSLHFLRSTVTAIRLRCLVRKLHRYYGPVRLPPSVHHRRISFGFPARTLVIQGRTEDLPASVRESLLPCEVLACMGSATPRDPSALSRLRADQYCLRPMGRASASRTWTFRGSIPSPHDLLSTLRLHPCECTRMTRSQMWLATPSSGGTFHPQHLADFGRRTPETSQLNNCHGTFFRL
jgi:hypothetical protein